MSSTTTQVVDGLRDEVPTNDLMEGAAIAFALGLGVARVVAGLAEVLFPRLFLRAVGTSGAATPGAAVGFRMKGGRDLAIGLSTLASATNGDREGVATMTALGVIVDAIDGLAVSRDGGRAIGRPVFPHGATLGYVVAAAAAWAATVLRRPTARSTR